MALDDKPAPTARVKPGVPLRIDWTVAAPFLRDYAGPGGTVVIATLDDSAKNQNREPDHALIRSFRVRLDDNGMPAHAEWIDVDGAVKRGYQPAAFRKYLDQLQTDGAGVYFAVNEVSPTKGRKAVVRPRALYADFDTRMSDDTRKLVSGDGQPSFIVQSSVGVDELGEKYRKLQCHWLLPAPGDEDSVGPTIDMDEYRAWEPNLVRIVKGDLKVSDAARVLRLPGSWHLKRPHDPFQVRVIHRSEMDDGSGGVYRFSADVLRSIFPGIDAVSQRKVAGSGSGGAYDKEEPDLWLERCLSIPPAVIGYDLMRDICFAINAVFEGNETGLSIITETFSRPGYVQSNGFERMNVLSEAQRIYKQADPHREGGISSGTLIEYVRKLGDPDLCPEKTGLDVSQEELIEVGKRVAVVMARMKREQTNGLYQPKLAAIPEGNGGPRSSFLEWLDDQMVKTDGKPIAEPELVDEALLRLGEEFPSVLMGANAKTYWLRRDGGHLFVDKIAIATLLEGRNIVSPVTGKVLPIWEFYWSSMARKVYQGVGHFPAGAEVPKGWLNRWTPFAVEPKPGDWSKTRAYITDVMCSGDPSWAFGWMAHLLQRPGVKMRSALCFLSEEKGTFKSGLFRALANMIGPDKVYHTTTPTGLSGKFNAHMEGRILVGCEEWSAAELRQSVGALKDLITNTKMWVEVKHGSRFEADSYANLMFNSNLSWAIPADRGERRYGVYSFKFDRPNDPTVFGPIFKELYQNDGLAAMMYDLLHWDLSDFDDSRPPLTQGLIEQTVESLSGPEAFVSEMARTGQYEDEDGNFVDLTPGDFLPREAYRRWAEAQGYKGRTGIVRFNRILEDFGWLLADHKTKNEHGKRVSCRGYLVPDEFREWRRKLLVEWKLVHGPEDADALIAA